MPDYRRAWHPAGTYFFTVNLLQRQGNDLLPCHIDILRSVVKSVQTRHPFRIHGWVVLPEHLHCVIELPAGETNLRCAHLRVMNRREKDLTRNQEVTMKISVETIVASPIDEVWRTYTTPEDIKQWNAASDDWHTTAATVDLRVGGAFSSRMEAKDGSMGFDFAGTYTNIVQHKLIEYSFGDRTAQVEFADSPKGVRVRITFDSEKTHSVEQQRDGWQAILNNFARHVEASR